MEKKKINSSILAIGTELLLGYVVNTNATYLSQNLNEIGINVIYHVSVGDNVKRLKEEFSYYLNKSDVIITTGGLGPTQDDLTKETIAQVFGLEMVFDEKQFEILNEYFNRAGRQMSDNNKKQCYFPAGSTILYNSAGTAPGCIIEIEDKMVIILPGPPREVKHLYDEFVKDYLIKKTENLIESRYLSVYGVGESNIENILLDLIDNQTDPTIATYAGDGKVNVRITSSGSNLDDMKSRLNKMESTIYSKLGNSIVSNEGKTISEVVVDQLLNKNFTISAAESCTGGQFISSIIKHPGVSKIVKKSYVTYSNEAKESEIDVSHQTLEKYGAVSEQVCSEMLLGLAKKTSSDICVAITGIAGPSGGTREKPVGLVYMGILFNGKSYISKELFTGSREIIQMRTVNCTLKKIYDIMVKINK